MLTVKSQRKKTTCRRFVDTAEEWLSKLIRNVCSVYHFETAQYLDECIECGQSCGCHLLGYVLPPSVWHGGLWYLHLCVTDRWKIAYKFLRNNIICLGSRCTWHWKTRTLGSRLRVPPVTWSMSVHFYVVPWGGPIPNPRGLIRWLKDPQFRY